MKGTGRERAEPWRETFVTRSPLMEAVFNRLRRVIGADVPVLITGETGTGKGLVARGLHAESARGQAPLCHVDCASLSENLIEAELYGSARGAFTGAERARMGRFEAAGEGTLYGPINDWVQSEAVILLDFGEGRLPGMLAIASDDPHQFTTTQGTDLLSFFGGVFERAMRRWLRRGARLPGATR